MIGIPHAMVVGVAMAMVSAFVKTTEVGIPAESARMDYFQTTARSPAIGSRHVLAMVVAKQTAVVLAIRDSRDRSVNHACQADLERTADSPARMSPAMDTDAAIPRAKDVSVMIAGAGIPVRPVQLAMTVSTGFVPPRVLPAKRVVVPDVVRMMELVNVFLPSIAAVCIKLFKQN